MRGQLESSNKKREKKKKTEFMMKKKYKTQTHMQSHTQQNKRHN